MMKNVSPGKKTLKEKYLNCQTKALKLLENGDLEKAQKQLEGLVQLNYKPSVYEVLTLNNLSMVYMRQKLNNKAMITLIKALVKAKSSVFPQQHIGTLFNLSAVASSLGIHSEAYSYASQALKLLQGTTDYKLLTIGYYNLGIECIFLSKHQEAEENLKKAEIFSNGTTNHDTKIDQLIKKALGQILGKKSKDHENTLEKPKVKVCADQTSRKKISLKKNFSNTEITSSIGTSKVKKIERVLKPIKKRTESHFSSRNITNTVRKSDKANNSGTSSTESINNSSKVLRQSLGSSKHLRRGLVSEKGSHQSTPLSDSSTLAIHYPEYENRILNIGDHLNTIERKLNDFVELCKPLKILTEDPDEQLDSYRLLKCNLKGIVIMQRIAKKRFYLKNIAAIRIQRAYREYRAGKPRILLKFKDNPLFKQGPMIKPQLSINRKH